MTISDTSGSVTIRPDSPARSNSTRSTVPDGRTDVAHFQASGFDPGGGGALPNPPQPEFGPTPGYVDPEGSAPPSPPEQGPIQGERPCHRWVIYEVFITRNDERVCPICGPLHGKQYERGMGPYPPLHPHCRCLRLEVRRECVSRE